MITDRQRKLIITNMAQRLIDGLPSDLSITITMFNDYVRENPAEGVERVDEVSEQERKEMTIMALRVALMEMESALDTQVFSLDAAMLDEARLDGANEDNPPEEPFSWEDTEHQRGALDCQTCWSGYPVVCANCDSLLHAHFGDESYEGYTLSKKCEGCGYDWKE